MNVYDHKGNNVSGNCFYYAGGTGTGLEYSSLSMSNPGQLEIMNRPISTNVNAADNNWVIRFGDVASTRDGRVVKMEGRILLALIN